MLTRKPLTLNRLRDKAQKYNYIIGIDPGVNTGWAIWDRGCKEFTIIHTFKLHDAIIKTNELRKIYDLGKYFVRVEDARKRTWFGKSGREQLQGAGSIKRDCKIWEDFLTDVGIDFEMVAPKNNKTKLDARKFKLITEWEGKTNEHSRDAAMLVYRF